MCQRQQFHRLPWKVVHRLQRQSQRSLHQQQMRAQSRQPQAVQRQTQHQLQFQNQPVTLLPDLVCELLLHFLLYFQCWLLSLLLSYCVAIIHCVQKKTPTYVFDYNSEVSWLILINFEPMETGMNALQCTYLITWWRHKCVTLHS